MRLVVLMVTVFFPSISLGQQITVRSGEHGTFTRLVFNIPSETDWELVPDQAENNIRLNLDMPPTTFDTTTVFSKIAKNRVSNLEDVPNSASIDINLSCDCISKAFMFQDRMLVIDLMEKQSDLTEVSGPNIDIFNSEKTPQFQTDLAQIWLGPMARIGPKKPSTALDPSVSEFNGFSGPKEKISNIPGDNSQTDIIRAQVFSDVAGAATQGLLETTRSFSSPARNLQRVDSGDAGAEISHKPTSQHGSILDRNIADKSHVSIGGRECVADNYLNFSKWGEDASDVSQVLSMRRSAIYGEFDKVNSSVLISYVRSLLYYGFGAEARDALALANEPKNGVLTAISYLVDGQDDPTFHFRDQLGCDGLSAVWAGVDGGGLKNESEIDKASVLRGFELLPQHLREHLGPIIADNLRKNGFSDTARDILRRLERMTGSETQSIAFANALIDLDSGNEERAAQAFKELAETQSPETAQAIAASVAISERQGVPVSERIMELSAAYSTELRDTELGSELWEAHLRSLIINEKFDEALKALQGIEGVDPEKIQRATNELLAAIVNKSDDLTFLKYHFQNNFEDNEMINDSTLLGASQRMLELGLPAVALDSLNDVTDPKLEHRKRLIQAKALLESSSPEEAEILLIGLTGDEVSKLRALARSLMGDHDYARTIYAGMGQKTDAGTEAWLSGDWNQILTTSAAPFSSVAGIIMANADVNISQEVSLSEIDDLHAASILSRDVIDQVLASTRLSTNNQ